MTRHSSRQHPGFGLSLGITSAYLGLLVILPLAALGAKVFRLSPSVFWRTVTSARVLASYRISFGAAFAAALVNAFAGLAVAWVLVRYPPPGKRIMDAIIDLPFALPTAVAGIALTQIYAPQGWFGRFFPFRIAYTPLGISIALLFIGLPFVVRTLQPVLEVLGTELEEAAATLGASRWQTLRRVVLPELLPALVTGFALAFARGIGEYGSVVFISGNMPMKTEIAPLLIITKLEQYEYPEATAIALVMLLLSFAMLLAINLLQRRLSVKVQHG